MDTGPDHQRKLNMEQKKPCSVLSQLRNMECPVGSFISNSLSEIPEKSRKLLESNIKDEDNHDLALGYIANALGVDDKAEAEALRLKEAWIAHPDHTILKALVIERAIFFCNTTFL